MNDTHPAIAHFIHEGLMRMSGAERLRLGAGAFDSARCMVEASLPPGLSEQERLVAVARRFYGELGQRAAEECIRRRR